MSKGKLIVGIQNKNVIKYTYACVCNVTELMVVIHCRLTLCSPPAPSPPLLEVTRISNTTFSLSVSLAYTGGGVITHFNVSFRNTGTISWNPLGGIPATPSPDSSLVWNGVMSRDEFAGMTLEFQVVVVNGEMFGSTATVVQEKLSKLVAALSIQLHDSSPYLPVMQVQWVTLYNIHMHWWVGLVVQTVVVVGGAGSATCCS